MNKGLFRKFGWVFALVALILFLLLLWYPQPTASGSCSASCTDHQVGVSDVYNVDADAVCGDGCRIEKIETGIQHPFLLTCECCDCVGDAELAKPVCGNGPLDMVYQWLGACV